MNNYTNVQQRAMWDGSEVTYYTETVVDQERARKDIEAMVERAKVELPSLNIRFGYVGDKYRNCDERVWYVWTNTRSIEIGQDFASNVDKVAALVNTPAIPQDALLEACRDMLEKIDRHYPNDWQGTKMLARAAIARAEA